MGLLIDRDKLTIYLVSSCIVSRVKTPAQYVITIISSTDSVWRLAVTAREKEKKGNVFITDGGKSLS